jgi:hypothetical protein
MRSRRASPRKQDASRVARLVAVRRRLALDVKLTLVARSDDRLSEAQGVLRLGRVPKRR